ncbi:MAG: DEAD/DEAH box helicase [Gemmatimonadales bacterium]|nr:DEAD/DEAH box helicase [Gemmatimonadales bacterium]NIN10371.1 DEAD/DEAH box helicase [Gemmatimonadales bacterium]NIN49163.1 DEAD/DEAH box helicase [Gemmatimonadales bacterium]NIP06627.1 DEAD/DEAH box helicase [Gemmatimonadales bacterium]NIQ99957.1 DEAD/DEAH box helicase [Gemmatimonadales bacterium]
MSPHTHIRDHFLPPDREAFRRAEPPTGRVIVIAPTRAACETIERACWLEIETVLEREHGREIRELAAKGLGFGIVAGTGTGKTLAIRPIAEQTLKAPLKVGVVNREREATPETPTWNVVIVTTGIARRWFQDELIDHHDTLIVDEIHQTSAELELCLALGKRVGCRFIWLSATVDPRFYARYLNSAEVLETAVFDPALEARVTTQQREPVEFLDHEFIRRVVKQHRGVAVFLPTRAQVEAAANELSHRWPHVSAAFYHGGEPIRVIRPFLDGTAEKPFVLTMTQAGQSALNIRGLDTVVIYDACFNNVVERGRNVLTRQFLGPNEILQMAGRVHGRVAEGEVYILSDREIDFFSLQPVPPEFQLAGDNERVALTAAALGVDLSDLDLPVPLDHGAYAAATRRLTERGIVVEGRLSTYGRDVEAMPVDRPWGELLVHADDDLVPFVAVAANIDSLHRMTREDPDLSGLIVYGSDHLTAYNVYAEAVNQHGYLGEVYGLPRHLLTDEINQWEEARGVLVKAIEDVALGMASVYRTLELPLPANLPYARGAVLQRFRNLIARVMPFDLVIDGDTADGERVRLSDASVCDPGGAVAGTIRYFADRFGVPRGAIEGTSIPFELIQRYATRCQPTVEFRDWRRRPGLAVVYDTEYFGFVLDRTRRPLKGKFPTDLAVQARDALVRALLGNGTPHPNQRGVGRAAARLDEYWRRSGGMLKAAEPAAVERRLREQLEGVQSWEDFLETPLQLDPAELVSDQQRAELDALPSSAAVLGDRVPLVYDIEHGQGVVRLRLREKQARRLRERDLPRTAQPLRFSVYRGKREVVRATSLEDLRDSLRSLPRGARKGRRGRRGYR